MRVWVKVTVGGAALVALAFIALAGTGAYFVFRHLDKRTAAEVASVSAIEAVRTRFGPRPALIEIADPRSGDIRINRPDEPSTTPVGTIHVINWKSDTGELVRCEFPLWLMRFSSVNVLSQLGVTPARFRLTVTDIERYGPGIVADYSSPGSFRILVWVD
ncbi:hypothetical protein BH18ACI5_BH18ACI5_05570 [soil metagenome]